jgi:hypothetical protein
VPQSHCVPVAVFSATGQSFFASKFSDRVPANFTSDSFPHGAGNFSNIPASISYQSNQALRLSPQRDATRIGRTGRIAFNAASTRNGYSLPQVNLSQTSAAMFAPYFVKISYPLRRNCGA